MIQQIANTTRHKLHRAIGQDAAVQHYPHTGLGHITGRRGRFHNRRHPRKKRRRQFLQHPPDRKVERVDMHRHTLQRRADMLAQECPLTRQLLHIAVEIDMPVRHLAPPLGGDDKHRADAAINVDLAVTERRAGAIGQLIQRLTMPVQMRGQRLEHARAVVERHGAQRRATHRAGMIAHRQHIQRIIARTGKNLACHRIRDIARARTGGDPVATGKAHHVQLAHFIAPFTRVDSTQLAGLSSESRSMLAAILSQPMASAACIGPPRQRGNP